MSKFSLARVVGVTAEGSADAAVAPAAAAVDEVGEITLEQKGALEEGNKRKLGVEFIYINQASTRMYDGMVKLVDAW